MKPPHVGYAIIACALACLALGAALGVRWSLWLHEVSRAEMRVEIQAAYLKELGENVRYRELLNNSDSSCVVVLSFPANVFAGWPQERCIWARRFYRPASLTWSGP